MALDRTHHRARGDAGRWLGRLGTVAYARPIAECDMQESNIELVTCMGRTHTLEGAPKG